MSKPIVGRIDISGPQGNAFYILGACQRVAKEAGWTQGQIDEFMSKATSSDYESLKNTCEDHFDIDFVG